MTPLCRAICRVEHCIINTGANRYALNPEEFCHGNIKQQKRNAAPIRDRGNTVADGSWLRQITKEA
jgi:hypothetical protein